MGGTWEGIKRVTRQREGAGKRYLTPGNSPQVGNKTGQIGFHTTNNMGHLFFLPQGI